MTQVTQREEAIKMKWKRFCGKKSRRQIKKSKIIYFKAQIIKQPNGQLLQVKIGFSDLKLILSPKG
jgi:hypothetical protein